MSLLDITPLVGRQFVSGQDNSCRIEKIGVGGMRVTWKTPPSPHDLDDFETWMDSILGPNLSPKHHYDIKTEKEAYSKFLQELKDESGN